MTTGSGVDDLLEGATATVVCDTDTGYVGLPPEVLIACQANGTWDTPTGCSLFGMTDFLFYFIFMRYLVHGFRF